MRLGMIAILVLACLLAAAVPVHAQTAVINPTTVEFMASPDHAAVGLDGAPVLTRYELRIYLESATSPVTFQDLGKPTPGANQLITLTNRAWFVAAAIAGNMKHIARVVAIGPSGETPSEPSGPFGNAAPPAEAGRPVLRR